MEKLNIAEILKDCPKGMELDCLIYEDVYFDYVDELNIIHCYIQYETHKTSLTFTQYGIYNSGIKAKCVIFPKGKTTWEGFVPPCKFEDGDVIYTKTYDSKWISIFEKFDDDECKCYVNYCIDSYTYYGKIGGKKNPLCEINDIVEQRLATEEEKQKLFDAIKANGYTWNPETKTLEKLIEPKFKVGDKIIHKVNKNSPFTITEITGTSYKGGYRYEVLIEQQDNFELVPNKFDINTLKPFESRVLVRSLYSQVWSPAIYGFKHFSMYMVVGGLSYCQCIPYEGNEHLLGTTNDCEEFYKTW